MPARSNEFQKLVKIINSHLAPVGAKVTESAMMHDSEARTDREVDILVETTFLNCPMKVGIECTATSRPLDIKPIEGFKEKHRKLGIHQTIVVAKNGFTKAATSYASNHNIKLLSFSAAKRKNWLPYFERVRDLSAYGRIYFLKEVSVEFVEASEFEFEFDSNLTVNNQGNSVSLQEFSAFLFRESRASQQAFKELKENEENSADPWVQLEFNLNKQFEFTDSNGRTGRPATMTVTYGYRTNYRSLSFEQIQYDGQDLAVGKSSGNNEQEHFQAVFSRKDDTLVGTLEFAGTFIPSPPSPSSQGDS